MTTNVKCINEGELSMKSVKFNRNWNNKLSCKYFTTLRVHNPSKYETGSTHRIRLLVKSTGSFVTVGQARVMNVRRHSLLSLDDYICGLDTGLSLVDTRKLISEAYPDLKASTMAIDLVLYKKIS